MKWQAWVILYVMCLTANVFEVSTQPVWRLYFNDIYLTMSHETHENLI